MTAACRVSAFIWMFHCSAGDNVAIVAIDPQPEFSDTGFILIKSMHTA